MKKAVLVLFFLFITAYTTCPNSHDTISADKLRWKVYFLEVTPISRVQQWLVPFQTKDRAHLKTVKIISTFGAPRLSFVSGHLHTGVDMIPAKRSEQWVYVFPMAPGVVCSIHLTDPHQTIVIKHHLADGGVIYSSYKHLGEIYVKTGQQVTAETRLARLYTRQEALSFGGNYDHLHLEIRKQFDDYGVASWATMSKKDLNLRFLDPLTFMNTHIK